MGKAFWDFIAPQAQAQQITAGPGPEFFQQQGRMQQMGLSPDAITSLQGPLGALSSTTPSARPPQQPPQPASIDRYLPLISALGGAMESPGGLFTNYTNTRLFQQQQENQQYRQALAAQLRAQQLANQQQYYGAHEQYWKNQDEVNRLKLAQGPKLGPTEQIAFGLAVRAQEPNPRDPVTLAKYMPQAQELQDRHAVELAGAKSDASTRARLNAEFSGDLSQAPGLPTVGPTAPPANRPVNEEALSGQSDGVKNVIRALVQYRIPLPTGFALRSPYWQRVLNLATQYDPTFDATQYNVRMGVRKDFTAGPSSKAINALNTVIGHLDTLKTNADALGNWSLPMINKVGNIISTQRGKPQVRNFELARAAVSRELTRVFRGSGGAEADIQDWQRQIDAAGSPAQLQGAINQGIALLESRMEALQNTYERGMGHPLDFRLLSPKSEQILQRLKGEAPDKPLDPLQEKYNRPTPTP